MLSGTYDSGLSTFEAITDASRDSGGARYLSYTVGDMKYTNLTYDSSGLIISYNEQLALGYGATVTQLVSISYDSSGSVKTITTS